MKYIPKKDKRVAFIAPTLIVFGILLYGMSDLIIYPAIISLAAVFIIVAGAELLVRYVLSEHIYVVDDRDDGSADLVVIKKTGKKEIKVCHLALSGIKDIYKKGENRIKCDASYNYANNPFAYGYELISCDGNKTVRVFLEADELFVLELKRRMNRDADISGISFAM